MSDQNNQMLTILQDAVSSKDIDPVKMQLLLDVQERIMNKQAVQDFDEAMKRVNEDLPRIIKKGSVGYKEDKNNKNSATVEAFKFARYEDVDEKLRPLLKREGFTLSFTSDWRDGGGLIMHATLSHKGGHSVKSSLPLALDTSGGKNNVQAMGSTTSYGRRYLCYMLFNIVTVGEDDDGKSAETEFVTKEEVDELKNALKLSDSDEVKFLEYVQVARLEDINRKDLKKIRSDLRVKMLKKEKASS